MIIMGINRDINSMNHRRQATVDHKNEVVKKDRKPKKIQITEEMQKALDIIQEHGSIVRYKGGFWARPGAEMGRHRGGPASQHYDYPLGTWVRHGTLAALFKRGLVEVADQIAVYKGAFPIKYIAKVNSINV